MEAFPVIKNLTKKTAVLNDDMFRHNRNYGDFLLSIMMASAIFQDCRQKIKSYNTEKAQNLSIIQHNVPTMVSVPRFSRSRNPMNVFQVV